MYTKKNKKIDELPLLPRKFAIKTFKKKKKKKE
jgi:hypothetical protein